MTTTKQKPDGIKIKAAFEDQVIDFGGKKAVTIHAAFLRQTGIANPNRDQMRLLLEELSKLFAAGEMEGGTSGKKD